MNLKEDVSHGTDLFPFCIYQEDSTRKIIPCHWHDEIEIIYVERGHGLYQMDSKEYNLQAEQALIVNSGTIHAANSMNKVRCFFILFHTKMLNSRFEDKCQINYIDPIANNNRKLNLFIKGNELWEKEIINQLKLIIKYYQLKPKGYELFLKSSLFRVLYEIINNRDLQKNNSENVAKIKLIKEVIRFIQKNYKNNLTSQMMAREINLSKYYFCRLFKSITGKTPIEYLNFYRINQAVSILQKYKNRKILDIAIDVGFNNFSYFIRTFKRFKGCTPTEYRSKYLPHK